MTQAVPAFMDADRELMQRLAKELDVTIGAFRAQAWIFLKLLVIE